MTYNDELYHWGVKGMKWGVRRYQNPDGTLTGAGRKRYGTTEKIRSSVQRVLTTTPHAMDQSGWTAKAKGDSNPWYASQQKTTDKLHNYTKSAKPRKVKDMTDDELNRRIARLQKEKQYLDLKSGTSPGKTYVTDLLKTSGNKIVGGAAGAIGGAVGKAAVDVIMNHYGDVTAAAVNGSKSAIVGAAFAAAMRA